MRWTLVIDFEADEYTAERIADEIEQDGFDGAILNNVDLSGA